MNALTKHRFRGLLIAFVCLLAVALLSMSPARRSRAQGPTTTYTVADLGTLGGSESKARGINNCGRVAGESLKPSGVNHPFVWYDEDGNGANTPGEMKEIGTGGGRGVAFGINGFGYVVGKFEDTLGQSKPFLWRDDNGNGTTETSEFKDLGTLPGGGTAEAYHVNDSNQAVGVSEIPPPENLDLAAFVWQAQVMTQLVSSAGINPKYALGINSSGNIVGSGSSSTGSHGFLKMSTGSPIDLGVLQSDPTLPKSTAWAISDDNYVVGECELPSSSANKPAHAFIWRDSDGNGENTPGEMKSLGTLGGTHSHAYDINGSHQVVGSSAILSGENHAFIWHDTNGDGDGDAGEMEDLNNSIPVGSGWTLIEARSINKDGQIVGFGLNPSGQVRAFLLTPTTFSPTPCSLAPTTVSAVSGNGTYNGTAALTATLSTLSGPLEGKSVAFTLNNVSVGSATTDANGVATLPGASIAGIDAGTYPTSVKAIFAGDTSFANDDDTGPLSVTKANQTINFGSLSNKTFGDASFTVSATGGGSTSSVTFGATGNCTSGGTNGSTITITGAGGCNVTASQAGDGNYNPATPVQRSFNIDKANQTINFGALSNKTFGDAPFTVSATGGGSTIPVTFGATGNCSSGGTNGSTITITGAGSCTVTASQAGDSNYNSATPVLRSFTINKAGQTITFGALSNKTFGDAPFTVSATGGGSTSPVTFVATGNCSSGGTNGSTITITGAGSCTVTASQAGDNNFTAATPVPQSFTINKANQTIIFGALSNKTFGEAPFTVSANGGGSSSPVTFGASGNCSSGGPNGSTITITGAGSCTVTASQLGDSNFNPATSVDQLFTILKASSAVAVTSSVNPSAEGQSVTFTATVSSPSGTPTGTVQFKDGGSNLGAPVALNASGVASLSTSALTAGTHTITADYSGDANFNSSSGSLSGGQGVGGVIQFSQPTYTIDESVNFLSINVTRTGNTTGPATVKYATGDATDVNFVCNPSTVGQITGAASRKCDYHIAAGRLRFAAGETSKTIVLSIVNDVYVEGSETLTIGLSSPTGGVLGSPNLATVTITDNDTPGQANPIDGTPFYVRMLYVDLLSREPDPAGFAGWVNRIDLCGQPGQAPPPCDRVTVGGDGFLRSAEFFDREFFVIRLYRSGLGRILRYDDVADLAFVSGFLTDADLELNKQEVVSDIMSRPEFGTIYNGLPNSVYVDTLISTAAVTLPAGVRDAWVTALDGSTKTRAQVFRELSERSEVSTRYLNEARVVSCYYGFFTRNPDGAYFSFLDRLDRGEINLGDLANAFINAAEYRQRFGP